MPPGHDETPPGPVVLARRLKELRENGGIKQGLLAEALGASTALISSWENVRKPVVPPLPRLESYAALFAPARSFDGTRLRMLGEDELTEAERAARHDLYAELMALRDAALPGVEPIPKPDRPRSTWHFPDGGPVRIVCGAVTAESRGAYADPASPNYTRLHGTNDPDALIELFGHIRMTNPDSDVRWLLGHEMGADDLTAHVVLLGGLRLNPAARFFAQATGLPVQQVVDENVENGEVFEIAREGGNRRFLPTFLEGDPTLGLIEDVGLFARMPNPNYTARTLTLCNGVFSRGVLGAVRTLTDRQLRESNEDYLNGRFAADSEFGLLLRVPVFQGEASTPDLTNDYHRLYAWSARKEPE
jgi:transcriptional regulator with XRE-family HTH domain